MGRRAVVLWFGLVPALILPGCRRAPELPPAADAHAGDWVVDPSVPGPDVPPAGHSLFDALAVDPVPFPFSRLLESINAKAGRVEPRRILIPLGRSLQRSAGAPEFFRYPRAVAAYDSERRSDLFVKDRLFLGYHEKAAVIEVISYNEEAGRFEFQLVKNYRAGASPQVYYARRTVCTTCHQNQGPLFPRQLWDETNSNYRVLNLLLGERREYYGFPIQQSADVPYAIDLAVHRANEVAAYQLVWRTCGIELRRELLIGMLRCRLSGNCESAALASTLGSLWKRTWPRGLLLPNPEIANRNPLAILSREGPPDRAGATLFLANRQKTIDPQFEPAVRREPLDVWNGDAPHVERVLTGLANFFSAAEIRDLDAYLASGASLPSVEYRAHCAVGEELQCEPASGSGFRLTGRLEVRGGRPSGSVSEMRLEPGGLVRDLDIAGGKAAAGRGGVEGSILLRRSGLDLSARCGDGNRISGIRFEGTVATLVATRDFERLAAAAGGLDISGALAAPAFRPAPILRELYTALGLTVPKPAQAAGPGRKPLVEFGSR